MLAEWTRGERTGKMEPLRQIATEHSETLGLVFELNPFCDRQHLKCFPEADDGPKQTRLFARAAHLVDKRFCDFQHVGGQPTQVQ